MTIVLACRFQEGAVVIADSRATWTGRSSALFQDTLQKILPLGRVTAIAYSGDVAAAELIVRELRKRIDRKPRLQVLQKLAAELPRIAKHYYGLHQARTRSTHPLALVLAGVTGSGKVLVWLYESPHFSSKELTIGFAVMGSGDVVADYMNHNWPEFSSLPDLKAKTDRLLMGLAAELRKHGVDTVGGMFQAISLQADGIRPFRYGFMDLNPELAGEAKGIEFSAGRWVQRDMSRNLEVPLVEPSRLIATPPRELRVVDYGKIDTQSELKWHLSHFVTCISVMKTPSLMQFEGVLSSLASPAYPISIEVLVAIAFWGPVGNREVRLVLGQDGEQREVHRDRVRIEYMPEEFEFEARVRLDIFHPGPAFLDCYVDGTFVGRRALCFGVFQGSPPADPKEFARFAEVTTAALQKEQASTIDPDLTSNKPASLVYYSLCQNCVDQDTLLRFEGEVRAVFWRQYPLRLRLFIATAFRMIPGEHRVRIELMNAATRRTSLVDTATIEVRSSCIVMPIHGDSLVEIPEAGIYFVNLHVDDHLVGSTVLPAETARPQYSYSLGESDLAAIAAGELHLLMKRSSPG